MKFRIHLVILLTLLATATTAQSQTTDSSPTRPSKFINMVHQELKAGDADVYEAAESSLITSYNRENVPVYWVGLESITGPPEILSLSFFESSRDIANSTEALDKSLAAHPELAQAQDRLLQDNTSGAETILAVRRDDMGYRTNTIDLAKMRILRVSTIYVHPGYERAFIQAEWTLSAANEKVNAQLPWVVYEVNAGLPEPTFIVLTPMNSLEDLDQSLTTDSALQKPENESVQEHLEELARVAYGNIDTYLFRVNPRISHVSREFAAADPQFWNTEPASASEAIAPKNAKPVARKAAPKP